MNLESRILDQRKELQNLEKRKNKLETFLTLLNSQANSHVPYPESGFLCYHCPDCNKKIGGEIIKEFVDENEKEYPFISYILWECECGYGYAEIEKAE